MSVARRFKGYFLHGLAVLLPSILTIWLFVWGYKFIQDNIGSHINQGLVHIIASIAYDKVEISEAELEKYVTDTKPELEGKDSEIQIHIRRTEIQRKARIDKLKNDLTATWVNGHGSIVGFLIAVVGVCVIGALLASYVGRTIWRMTENFILNTPLLKRVYPYIKQVTDFFLSQNEQKKLFTRIVAVEYPRQGIWTVGFVTGSGIEKVARVNQQEYLTVLIPTSPAPFTGFVITVPKKDAIDLDMTLEEAVRFMVSGGVISPSAQKITNGSPQIKIEGGNE